MKVLIKAKNFIQKIWKGLDGKKTTIGAIIVIANKGMQVFFPKFLTPDQYQFIEDSAMALTGAGLFHKTIKSKEKISTAIKKAVTGVNNKNK